MAKRGAELQITKDGGLNGHSDDENPRISFASADTMAKRKILKPRGKNFTIPTPPTAHPSETFKAPPATNHTLIKALNRKFVDAVTRSESAKGVEDFRPIAERYLDFYSKIESGSIKPIVPTISDNIATNSNDTKNPFSMFSSKTAPVTLPTSTDTAKPKLPKADSKIGSDSDSDSDEQPRAPIQITGPKFNLTSKPTIKNSPFSFGTTLQKATKADSDSESDIEIKGPSFTFTKQILDPVFKLAFAANNDSGSSHSKPSLFPALGSAKAETTEPGLKLGENGTTSEKSLERSLVDSLNGASHPPPQFSSLFKQHEIGSAGVSEKSRTSVAAPLFSFGTNQSNDQNVKSGTLLVATPFDGTDGTDNKEAVDNSSTEKDRADEDTGVNFTPVASLGGDKVERPLTGEEDESIEYQKKAKVMSFDSTNKADPYTNLGVGELKILKSRTKKSARIVVRAEGGFRVLLNVAILKDVVYATLGNGSLVRVPAVNDQGNVETFVLKVKTPESGKELCDILNKVKSDGT